jgi:hypothetical protein
MRPWTSRSKEAAYLFNPAFSCAILTATIVNYSLKDNLGMPFPLAFITLPVILHKQTRAVLPFNTRTSLAAWLEEKPLVRVQFYDRAVTLKPFVREAILFGTTQNWLTIEAGRLTSSLSEAKVTKFLKETKGEARDCILRARLFGKWLALAGSAETIMALWEIRP